MFLAENVAIEALQILLPVALILVLSKLLQMLCKKIHLPQVVGMLLAGIILSILCLNDGVSSAIFGESGKAGIKFLAEIGVVLIMFSAGLGTDIQAIKKSGVAATVTTVLGVVVPMALGFVVAGIFNGFSGDYHYCQTCAKEVSNAVCEVGHSVITIDRVWSSLFYGVILTATSVSVTVATLKELGKLNGKAGTIIISAAILDDIIGVVVLSVILSLSGASSSAVSTVNGGFDWWTIGDALTGKNADLQILSVIINVILFFAFVIGVGVGMHYIFKALNKKRPHTRRIPVFGLALAFFMAWAAETWFGVADITGAYFAGLALSGIGKHINPQADALKNDTTDYIERKSDVLSYMIFSPLFFANVGLNTDFSTLFSPEGGALIGFGVCFILAGLVGKVFGCGFGAKVTGSSWKDSLRIGVGMMARAEVALICATKGMSAGLVNSGMAAFIVVMIIISSFATPLILKMTYKNEQASKEDYDKEVFTNVVATESVVESTPMPSNYNSEDLEP